MEVGGAIAGTHVTADLTLPVEVIQDNDEARVEVHRRPLGVVGLITPVELAADDRHLACDSGAAGRQHGGDQAVGADAAGPPCASSRWRMRHLRRGGCSTSSPAAARSARRCQPPGYAKIVFSARPRPVAGSAGGRRQPEALTLELDMATMPASCCWMSKGDCPPGLWRLLPTTMADLCRASSGLYVHDSIYDALCGNWRRSWPMPRWSATASTRRRSWAGAERFAQRLPSSRNWRRCASGTGAPAAAALPPGAGYFYAPTVVADQRRLAAGG